MTDGIGPTIFARLLVHFGDAERALGATAGEMQRVKGLSREGAERVAVLRDQVKIDAEIELAAHHGVRILCREDADYPYGLRKIPDAPIVIYVKGELRETDAVAVAIVGSRHCSTYGAEQARRFGELLSGAGFTVVSGLARGVDAFAHHGAVDSGGRSIAVMGSGLPEIFPPENKALADRLLEHGAWISELPMGMTVRPGQFPSRNRIIAGMSLGTLVVEAQTRSGALITARLATEYNREVFAIPGRIQDPMSIGTNRLIRDGAAKLVTCLEDILDELGDVGGKMRKGTEGLTESRQTPRDLFEAAAQATEIDSEQKSSAAALAAPIAMRLGEAERRVYESIPYDPVLQEQVLAVSQLPPGEVIGAFTTLELKGLIKRLPGQLVVRVGRA